MIKSTADDWQPLLFFSILYFIFLLIVVKYLYIPAIKNQAALELNERGIIDHVYGLTIDWNNIYNIGYEKRGITSFIVIDLKNRKIVTSQTKNIYKKLSFLFNRFLFGTPIAIASTYIKGKKSAIFNATTSYFQDIQYH